MLMHVDVTVILTTTKIWNASRICVSSLRRGHANLLCIVPILVYVLPKQAQCIIAVPEHVVRAPWSVFLCLWCNVGAAH